MTEETAADGGRLPRTSHAAYVQVETPDGRTVYTGEAIYRPGKAHPLTGEAVPSIGIPDDAMSVRPSASVAYQLEYNGDRIASTAVYLDRVATCWWFVLARPPRHPPRA